MSSVAIVSVVWFTSTSWRRDQICEPLHARGPGSTGGVLDGPALSEAGVTFYSGGRIRNCYMTRRICARLVRFAGSTSRDFRDFQARHERRQAGERLGADRDDVYVEHESEAVEHGPRCNANGLAPAYSDCLRPDFLGHGGMVASDRAGTLDIFSKPTASVLLPHLIDLCPKALRPFCVAVRFI